MYKALFISPMIPSFNVRETVLFFTDILEFTVVMDSQQYVILKKDGLTIHVETAGSDIGEMEFYIEVDNIDLLWTSIKDKVMKLKVREPFNRDYGMREIHILIPHTKTLLFIGQEFK